MKKPPEHYQNSDGKQTKQKKIKQEEQIMFIVEINFTGYDENEGVFETIKFYAPNLPEALDRISSYADRSGFTVVDVQIENAE